MTVVKSFTREEEEAKKCIAKDEKDRKEEEEQKTVEEECQDSESRVAKPLAQHILSPKIG